jgi:hypothetical protein
MKTEEIWIGDNEVRRKLEGEELAEFLAHRESSNAKREAAEAEQVAKLAAKESAIAKLTALGLTEDEAKAIIS